jgi:hypothetical protein
MKEPPEFWPVVASVIAPMLGEEDDSALWPLVLDTTYADAQVLARLASGHHRVLTQIGRCSHWLAPNQCRWTAEGSFAWPSGYGAAGFSLTGLPDFDWFGQWAWHPESQIWMATDGRPSSRDLVFRVAVPSRTRRHNQAAVHTVWRPGAPPLPRVEVMQFYGFRRHMTKWSCTAYRYWSPRGQCVYEEPVVAESINERSTEWA